MRGGRGGMGVRGMGRGWRRKNGRRRRSKRREGVLKVGGCLMGCGGDLRRGIW